MCYSKKCIRKCILVYTIYIYICNIYIYILINFHRYTPYTPYQAEISQGRLHALSNFQTIVSELTGMDVANASLLDEGTAAAEAMMLMKRSSNSNYLFLSNKIHPQTMTVVQGRAKPLSIHIILGDENKFDFSRKDLFGAIIQYPDTFGGMSDYTKIAEQLHANDAKLCVASDLLALTLLKPPGEFGADLCVGSSQRFGVPMGFGGPHAAFFSGKIELIRKFPGRIVGVSVDRHGKKCLRLALQTREQHIRKDKATSNVCTAQALLANIAGFYATYHGPKGLFNIAARVHELTTWLHRDLVKIGCTINNADAYFDTLDIDIYPHSSLVLVNIFKEKKINIRNLGLGRVSVSLDELTTCPDLQDLLDGFGQLYKKEVTLDMSFNPENIPNNLKRTTPFMTQQIFSSFDSETEMMRYLKHLENCDLGLNTSMIPLGSCTMKLNSAASLVPIMWSQFRDIHPFAPSDQTEGYAEMLYELEDYLRVITGFDGVSLQPNSGASGEFAGLLAIKQFHTSIGESQRNICLIPQSAHGTNFASAIMAGMKVVTLQSNEFGTVDLANLKSECEAHKETLSCLMITYPSTLGIFEEGIQEICEYVHANGGNVYMDGANMNAQVGLTSPFIIGADVCHLNLHKTFSIPHGGGGPGVGPICVREHLTPFLPGHDVIPPHPGHRQCAAVSAAPWGSAMILPVPWMYITMLGSDGLMAATKHAILNANYLMNRLENYYEMRFKNRNGRCAHEFIIDVAKFKKVNINEEDISKRLADYGYHAPTVSWPVQSAIMIEPTESEDKGELDRFCEAMILIRKEIQKIEDGIFNTKDNLLKNAPHTQREVCGSEWTHPYTREEAAFPAPWIEHRGKFWPAVGRVDNVYGDKNILLDCEAVSNYIQN
eukprot:GHVL01026534.1.p1 GENE.GHVL01026534.1~~GHVL01026534.1.p1  ORF type:complete len:886 (-),score=149.69 GHVL01026534.1:289-2946(-)